MKITSDIHGITSQHIAPTHYLSLHVLHLTLYTFSYSNTPTLITWNRGKTMHDKGGIPVKVYWQHAGKKNKVSFLILTPTSTNHLGNRQISLLEYSQITIIILHKCLISFFHYPEHPTANTNRNNMSDRRQNHPWRARPKRRIEYPIPTKTALHISDRQDSDSRLQQSGAPKKFRLHNFSLCNALAYLQNKLEKQVYITWKLVYNHALQTLQTAHSTSYDRPSSTQVHI